MITAPVVLYHIGLIICTPYLWKWTELLLSTLCDRDPLSIVVDRDTLSKVVDRDPLSTVDYRDPLSTVDDRDPLSTVEDRDPLSTSVVDSAPLSTVETPLLGSPALSALGRTVCLHT